MNQGGYGDGGEYYNPYGGGYDTANQQYDAYNDGTFEGGGSAQGQYYEDGSNQQYQEGYYEQGNEYYPEQPQEGYGDQNQYGEYPAASDYGVGAGDMTADPHAPFHPSRPPFVAHPNGRADDYGNYDAIGDPISAFAIDDGDSSNDAPGLMYVASHTSKHGGGRSSAPGGRGSVGVARLSEKDPALSRGSRMTVLYGDSNVNNETGGGFYGNRTMYSSFVAHPEAKGHILDGLHSALLGGGSPINIGSGASSSTVKARPTHAYGPSFGPPSWAHRIHLNAPVNPHFPQQQSTNRPEERHCMGISSIFPVSTPYLGSGGRVCTVSPHGVRIHTRGGMVMSDRSDGYLSGMTCGDLLGSQFATICGMSFPSAESNSSSRRCQHVHSVDVSRDLKIVSSHTLVRNNGGSMCVADMATNHERSNIVVGCTDGTIRVLDGGRRNAEVAKATAQPGGVAKVAVSENLIVASGYSSAGSSSPSSPLPYPFPAPHVLIYDVRYLGRGGIPHMFSGRGGPRFVDFLPDVGNSGSNSVLIGSGQTFGGFEIITPFSNDGVNSSTYFQPELISGESMSVVDFQDGELIIGTSHGRVLQYGLAHYDKTIHSSRSRSASGIGSVSTESFRGGGGKAPAPKHVTEPLDIPPFAPAPPALSIDPTILCSPPQQQSGLIQGWNVFDSYVMSSEPLVSTEKASFHPRYSRAGVKATTLGPMSSKPLVAPSKRFLSKGLQSKVEREGTGGGGTGDMKVFQAAALELTDLLAPGDAGTENKETGYRGKKGATKKSFPNPNRLLYSAGLFAACYDATANPRGNRRPSDQQLGEEDWIEDEENGIPTRYRLTLHPSFLKASRNNFDYAQHNDTGLVPGWDYPPSFANSSQCAVLALLYFVGEIRDAVLKLQLCGNEMSVMASRVEKREMSISITSELGFLFHLIEGLSANGLVQPQSEFNGVKGQVKAFVPSNVISAFAMLPEAKNLALIDGVAGSAELARRPEAFYRFLMQYMERELGQVSSRTLSEKSASSGHLIDRMQGIDFVSVIEYNHSDELKPKISTSRALTVDLAYDQRLSSRSSDDLVRFGEILRFSLCKDAPLRAWCEETRSYEAVIQRKIATSLPSLLSLSCCCAGERVDTEGLKYWRSSQNFLPEFIEVQIESDQSVTVRELATNGEGEEEWLTFEQKLPLSDSFFDGQEVKLPQNLPIKKVYRLDAVISFVQNGTAPDEGHHVVHVRAQRDLQRKLLTKQLECVELCMSDGIQNSDTKDGESSDATATDKQDMTLASDIPLQERQELVKEQLRKLEEEDSGDEWLLLNGFVVSKIDDSSDVRSYNAKFKQPSIVLFREITEADGTNVAVNIDPSKDLAEAFAKAPQTVSPSIMGTSSISNGQGPKHTISDLVNLPTKGDLVAIDAEFVCVQAEESTITYSGSKEITAEPRNALARLSIINCQTNEVIIDDYVLPREPVVDYLTRFSGIEERDLDAKNSPHHLVTPEEAYLKVRLLMERGCIFVGHGLSQDFRMINICIPPNQIIDTANIYHQPNQRYISLRYLTNYVLGRDMQQEVHDSIEDAKAALELYEKALSLKRNGEFDDYLMQLYAHGQQTQFKLGVAHK